MHTANGWNWHDEWVRDGRFRPEYLPGGVVSGRWATRGGGALQIPRALRAAVVADPGHRLVVADAAQLEPRVLAAMSEDAALQALSADADLYTALADDGFGGDRAHAKLAMLGAMYGQTSGEAGGCSAPAAPLPGAMEYVEGAARRGERGEVVRSVLGRACPPPSDGLAGGVEWGSRQDATDAERARPTGRARTAAGSPATSSCRRRRRTGRRSGCPGCAGTWPQVPGAELVFFQHDELIVHVPMDECGAGGRSQYQGGAERRGDWCSRGRGQHAGPAGGRRLVRGRQVSVGDGSTWPGSASDRSQAAGRSGGGDRGHRST